MWTKKQIEQHKRAAFLLDKIKNEAFIFIAERIHPSTRSGGKEVTEWQVHEFILGQYKKHGLVTAGNKTIVAFGRNTRHIHYYPEKTRTSHLATGSLVMLDIWARLRERGAPYADITWMAYAGRKAPPEIQMIFDIVIEARDRCLEFIQAHSKWNILPTGKEADSIARNVIMKAGFEKTFRHSTGHGLGLVSPHWRGRNLSQRNKYALLPQVGYTIEPGIYLKDEQVRRRTGFGCRSEMNFYIGEKGNLAATTPLQRKIVLI
jgi:Xaa-Pro aminopeptidase